MHWKRKISSKHKNWSSILPYLLLVNDFYPLWPQLLKCSVSSKLSLTISCDIFASSRLTQAVLTVSIMNQWRKYFITWVASSAFPWWDWDVEKCVHSGSISILRADSRGNSSIKRNPASSKEQEARAIKSNDIWVLEKEF